jgi:hypothetical protein
VHQRLEVEGQSQPTEASSVEHMLFSPALPPGGHKLGEYFLQEHSVDKTMPSMQHPPGPVAADHTPVEALQPFAQGSSSHLQAGPP